MTVEVWPLVMERAKADRDQEYAAWEKRRGPFWLRMLGCGPMTFDAFCPPPPKPFEWFYPPSMAYGDLYGPYPTPRLPNQPIEKMQDGDLYA